jgi:hypothetical protein
MAIALALGMPAIAKAAPAPPLVLAPYIADGQFEPKDFAWLKGAFPEATIGERAAFEQINGWLKDCAAFDRKQIVSELTAMGVAADEADIWTPRDPVCGAVSMPNLRSFKSYAELNAADTSAKPIADSFLYAVKLADETRLTATSRGESYRFRTIAEQMLRKGLSWGEGSQSGASPLAPLIKTMVRHRLGIAMAQQDHANTEWLKKLVDAEGWPTISAHGKEASQSAWLLVQHADADPPFQLKALRLMEPLAKAGEVDKSNYAYLYDRVMLKITGKQRYGTQMTCRAGKRLPQPLESDSALNSRRVEAGLPTMLEYLTMTQKAFGDCPPDRR